MTGIWVGFKHDHFEGKRLKLKNDFTLARINAETMTELGKSLNDYIKIRPQNCSTKIQVNISDF